MINKACHRAFVAGTTLAVAKYARLSKESRCDGMHGQTTILPMCPPARQHTSDLALRGAGKQLTAGAASTESSYTVCEKTIAELGRDMSSGAMTSETLVKVYLKAIADIDQSLNSVLRLNPTALADACSLDAERASGVLRGPLHGIPILIKDNIETADPMPTTAGSLALCENMTGRDAPVVARLRAAGAVILGKTNLSEWANIRSTRSASGWSAVGGITRNPYALDRTACGSSSGSGAAVAANLAAAGVGTETDGSVTCPAAMTGLVGMKPTVGLISRRHIVPISSSQDTAGPMTRTVQDLALMLTVMAGTDPLDPATWEADIHCADYLSSLDPDALKGARIGVARFVSASSTVKRPFEEALAHMRAAGAELVEISEFPAIEDIGGNELTVLLCELKTDLASYLADAAPAVKVKNLTDIIDFNEHEFEKEMPYFGQEHFLAANATKGKEDPAYTAALQTSQRLAGPEGIDWLLRHHSVDALVAPTTGPAWTIDLVNGDHFSGAATTLPAVAGYPHVTVPMGQIHGLPVGLSFIGGAWSEQRLLSLAYGFEQRTQARKAPTFAERLPAF